MEGVCADIGVIFTRDDGMFICKGPMDKREESLITNEVGVKPHVRKVLDSMDKEKYPVTVNTPYQYYSATTKYVGEILVEEFVENSLKEVCKIPYVNSLLSPKAKNNIECIEVTLIIGHDGNYYSEFHINFTESKVKLN